MSAEPETRTGRRRNLTEPEAYALLARYRLPVVEHRLAGTADEAVAVAGALGFPVALKVVSPEILHKSDAGGVALGLNTADEVRAAFGRILESGRRAAPAADIRGCLVSKMAAPGTEVIIGMTRDPQFGPAMMFGLGGIFVEVYKDVTFRLSPLTEIDAREMIEEIKGFPILRGIRGQRPRDLGAIVSCLLASSRLAEERPEVHELDLNPVVVYEEGSLIVDAKVVVEEPEPAEED